MPTPVKNVGPALQNGSDLLRPDSFLPVANGTHFNGNGGATSTSLVTGSRCYQTRKLLRVIAGGADTLQVEWANIWTSNTPQTADASCEIAGPNSVTVRMAIEYPAGNMRMTSGSAAWSSATTYVVGDQVTSGGSKWVAIAAGTNQTPATGSAYWEAVGTYVVNWGRQTDTAGTVVFAAGDYKKSLPIAISTKTVAGKKIAILGAFDSGSSANYIPYAGANGAANFPAATPTWVDWVVTAASMPAVGSSIVETGITNQTNGNTTTSGNTTASTWMKIPYATAITGNIPIKRCVALFGDSLMQGTGGDVRDGEPCGIFPRSVDGTPWWRIAQGGNRAGCYVPGNAPWQMSVVARCTATITNMGMNDINANLTFAQVQAAMQKLWTVLSATGTPLYMGCNLTPISASTDNWATAGANQTRYTGGGVVATTQNPNDDATYLTSVYGQIAMWLSQDGASMTVDGVTVKAGQINHPIESLVNYRSIIADEQRSWQWKAGGYTTDGAHPNPLAALLQGAYLAPQMEPIIMGRQQVPSNFPPSSPTGDAPVLTFPRSSAVNSLTTFTGSLLGKIGTSPGRYFVGLRAFLGAGTGAVRNYSILAGADPAKLKVIQTGTTSMGANSLVDLPFTGWPIWIPAGYDVYLDIQQGGTLPVMIGQNAVVAAINATGATFCLAGSRTATAVQSGVVNTSVGAGVYAAHVHRMWGELY
jgi:hypothetical protein